MSSNQEHTAFVNPKHFGLFNLGTAGESPKMMTFTWDQAVIPEAKIVFILGTHKITEYTVGNGLERSNNNQTLTVSLQGMDFDDYVGKTVEAHCNFFFIGNTEVRFDLEINRTFV